MEKKNVFEKSKVFKEAYKKTDWDVTGAEEEASTMG